MAYIIEDTRQKQGQHNIKREWWAQHKTTVTRCRLPFGDYAAPPRVAVDTKANMSEIATNMCGTAAEHARFREECKRAQAHGCKLYFLIENEDGIEKVEDVKQWVNPRLSISPKAVTGERLMKSMITMSKRYGCEFMFCKPEEAAETILRLLGGDDDADG